MTVRKILYRGGLTVTALALATTLSACVKTGGGDDSGGTSGLNLVKAGTLTVCTHLPYRPFQYKDDSGKVIGFDVDYIDLVAKKLNLKQEIVDTPFDGIKSGQDLSTRKCDLAAAGMTIKPERQQVMDFSKPYFDAEQAVVTRPGSPYKTLTDLKGKRVGSETATTGLDYLKKHAGQYGYTAVDYRDQAALNQALEAKQIEALVMDLPVYAVYSKDNPGKATIVSQIDTGEQYGFAIGKGKNAKLLQTTNDVIEASKKDGTYLRLYKKWIGTPPVAAGK